ncbi:MAG TPA: two-component system sensor protein, partial [Polyangiaceae bacterium]|nr:two-component system sensor protein [Polyangiaceae bacterium]
MTFTVAAPTWNSRASMGRLMRRKSARIRAMSAGQSSVPAREERFVRADGSVLHAEVIAMRSVFQGEPVVVAIGRDRTEDRRIRAELAHADRVGSIGRLAAGVAHEVNNPL